MSRQPQVLLCQFYHLVTEGNQQNWQMVNTGFVQITQKNELVVLQKDTNDEVHKHSICPEIEYTQSEEEAIQFTLGPEDYALSFQNKQGAHIIWTGIQNILSEEAIHQSDDDDISLTPVNEQNLEKILDTMNQLLQGGQNYRLYLQSYLINKQVFLERLSNLFDTLENKKNKHLLQVVCEIVKIMVTVSQHELFQILLNDQYYQFIFGALEYDEEMQKQGFIRHREFLQKQSQFIQVVQVKSKEKQKLIYFLYRLQYLRDCALAYYLDEMQLIYIKIIIKNGYSELIKYIENSKEFLTAVLDQLRIQNLQALKFLLEICGIFKEFPEINRIQIYSKFSEYGLYEILEEYLQDFDRGFEKLRAKLKKNKTKINEDQIQQIPYQTLELIICILQNSPTKFKFYISHVDQKVLKCPLYTLIIKYVTKCSDPTLQGLFVDVLKLLIEIQPEEEPESCDLFLEKFFMPLSSQVETSNLEFRSCFLDICYELSKQIRDKVKEALINCEFTKKFNYILNLNNKFELIKCFQITKQLLKSKDEAINQILYEVFKSIIRIFVNFKRQCENLLFSQILEIIKMLFEEENHSMLQNQFDEILMEYKEHANYDRVNGVINNIKNSIVRSIQIQPSLLPNRSQAQQNMQFDDEQDLFKSAGNKQKPQQRQIVDYDDEHNDPIAKKVKID
ncbi:hypothetical protein pb186bvf_004297 [Paramecium bursaria]